MNLKMKFTRCLTHHENVVEAAHEIRPVGDAQRLEHVVLVVDHLHGALNMRHRHWPPGPRVL